MQEFRAAESGGQIRQLCTGEHFIHTSVREELVLADMDGIPSHVPRPSSHVDADRPLNRAAVLLVISAQSPD